jgi:hypothetical protein
MTPIELITLLVAASKASMTIYEFALKLKERLKQTGEMTPEQEYEWDRQMQELMQQPHWKPSDQP